MSVTQHAMSPTLWLLRAVVYLDTHRLCLFHPSNSDSFLLVTAAGVCGEQQVSIAFGTRKCSFVEEHALHFESETCALLLVRGPWARQRNPSKSALLLVVWEGISVAIVSTKWWTPVVPNLR